MSGALDTIIKTISDNRELAMGLAAAGASGLAGGALSSSIKNPKEDKAERRRRIIRDSIMAATLGGAATGAGLYAKHQYNTARPKSDPGAFSNVGDVSGFQNLLNSDKALAVNAGGVLLATHGGARHLAQRNAKQQLSAWVGKDLFGGKMHDLRLGKRDFGGLVGRPDLIQKLERNLGAAKTDQLLRQSGSGITRDGKGKHTLSGLSKIFRDPWRSAPSSPKLRSYAKPSRGGVILTALGLAPAALQYFNQTD